MNVSCAVGGLIGAVVDFAKYLNLFKSNRVVVLLHTVFIAKTAMCCLLSFVHNDEASALFHNELSRVDVSSKFHNEIFLEAQERWDKKANLPY